MTELKTKRNKRSVRTFLGAIPDKEKRRDAFALLDIMQKITKSKPEMWGSSIVGFGSYHYKYSTGREADWPLVGFSPRKQNLTVYIMAGFTEYDGLLEKLGKHKTGKSCLYIKSLEDVHIPTLKKLVKESVRYMKNKTW